MPPFDPTLLHDFPDRAIRKLLQDPGNLRDLLGAVVPDLAAGFDCDHAELLPPVFPLDDWRHRDSDLLLLIPYRRGKGRRKVLVCVLLEHQSAADARMPLRMLLYTVLFWEREWKQWEERTPPRPEFRLTPVLPIVFHTGARPWSAPRTLAELVTGPEAFRPFVPQQPVLWWDLAEQSVEGLLASAAEWLQTLAVIRAEGAEREEFFRVMRQVVQSVSGLAPDQAVRWHGLLWFIVSWALQRRPPGEREALVEIAQAAQQTALAREEVGRMSQTIADSLREEGKREGREEGKREGREEGKLLAVREVLLHLLRDRFRRVPKAVRQQIAATTDVQRLQACVLQVNKVESLDELPL